MGAVHPAVPVLVSLVCGATIEKGIPVGVCVEEAAGYPEAVPKLVEARVSLSMRPPSITGIEKLVGEL